MKVEQISVGGNKVGMVGLKEVFQELVNKSPNMTEAELKEELFNKISQRNYIPPKAQEAYSQAFLREFKKFAGLEVEEEAYHSLEIKVLGTGCPQCDGLERSLIQISSELGIRANIEHVRSPEEIAKYKAFALPALVINGQIKSMGLVPPPATLREWLKKAALEKQG